MKKKLLSAVLSAMMMLSMFSGVVVSAETTLPDNLGTDYTYTDVLNGNLFTDENPNSADTHANSSKIRASIKIEGESVAADTNGDVRATNYLSGNGPLMTSKRTVLDPWAVYTDADGDGTYTLDPTQQDYKYPLAGSQLKLSGNAGVDPNLKFPTPDYTKNVVVRVPLKITDGTGTAKINIARSIYQTKAPNWYTYVGNAASDHEYPMEYNGRDQGVTVAATGKTYLNATFAGNTTAATDPQYSYTLGMVMGTDAGITVNMLEDEFYIGYEYAKDLTVEADTINVFAGTAPITVDADVLNQVGNKGGLSQGVTWYALNEERTAEAEGFTIVGGADGTATVSTASTVPAGKYTLVAVADSYPELVKGITINIIGYANDYVPAEEITGNATTGTYNSYAVSYSDNGVETTITKDGACGNGILDAKADKVAHGVGLSVPDRASIWAAGRTIVFGAKVKNNGGAPRAKLGVWQASNPSVLPLEAPGVADGIAVTETTDWQDIGFTIQVPTSAINGPNDVIFYFGFADTPEGQTEGSRSMVIKNDSVYLGLEYAYDIKLSADTTKWIPGTTEEINLDCDIVNQIGTTGTLNQDVEWIVMDSTRTTVVDGITITDSGMGDGKAKVVVDHYTVPADKYSIVAVSKANGQFIKGIEIEVEPAAIISELNLTKSGSNFVADAKLLNCDSEETSVKAMIVIVCVDKHDEVISYKTQEITNTYSTAASTATTTLEATSAVHHANAFLWETTGVDTPDILDTTLKELAPMKTLDK